MHKVSQHNETDLIVGGIIYPCDICDYVAESKVNLIIHIETKHRKNSSQYNKTPTMCDQCDHISSSKGNLKIHIEGKHNTSIEYSCDFCDNKSLSKYSYSQHIHRHENLNLCDECPYTGKRKTELNYH